MDTGKPAVMQQLALVLTLCPVRGDRDRKLAVRLAENAVHRKPPDARGLDILAAAYSAVGRFKEALATAGKAQALAVAAQNPAFAKEIAGRQEVYRQALSADVKSPVSASAKP